MDCCEFTSRCDWTLSSRTSMQCEGNVPFSQGRPGRFLFCPLSICIFLTLSAWKSVVAFPSIHSLRKRAGSKREALERLLPWQPQQSGS